MNIQVNNIIELINKIQNNNEFINSFELEILNENNFDVVLREFEQTFSFLINAEQNNLTKRNEEAEKVNVEFVELDSNLSKEIDLNE